MSERTTAVADDDLAATREYFAHRAVRYALCLRSYPFARVLDLIPYCYLLRDAAARLGKEISELRVLDAFGGTGFLSYAFRHSGIQFTVADCCPAMLELGHNHARCVNWRETKSYFTHMAETEAESYDVILCHGGLHHVIGEREGQVDHNLSHQRQALTIRNFSRLLVCNGVCIIGDVPAMHPAKAFVGTDSQLLPNPVLREFLGDDQVAEISGLRLRPSAYSLAHLADAIRHHFSTPSPHHVPRHFFDHFVSKETPLGHKASFISLEALSEMARDVSLGLQTQLDYIGPWLFPSRRAAAWFFREKFSYGQSTPIGETPETEDHVAHRIEEELGARQVAADIYAVNWGVVYSAFVKS